MQLGWVYSKEPLKPKSIYIIFQTLVPI